ncbi:uncharacterized protein PHACADRAFT_260228 [Phanerochaete carnosa HHB-10118-sp]|uniref:Uncharacterized protein n=1 Tax=Phanerochaete carnosa (strain HHB-10118-sp) TaxID=650164 RepID=K5W3M5_PHACS|nr:uncharacterized protein PHACADRAFT_260228 [Phanerochaete carnosa HHB-10118-sp]EKM53730.1 hypothetical protein PHACADRAFT_260228 [Phanerochaete carnosa HHB-10118-sp]
MVNVSRTDAHTFGPRYSVYSTSKLAVLRFAEFVNVDYGAQGVLVDMPELVTYNKIVWLVRERYDWLVEWTLDGSWRRWLRRSRRSLTGMS